MFSTAVFYEHVGEKQLKLLSTLRLLLLVLHLYQYNLIPLIQIIVPGALFQY